MKRFLPINPVNLDQLVRLQNRINSGDFTPHEVRVCHPRTRSNYGAL